MSGREAPQKKKFDEAIDGLQRSARSTEEFLDRLSSTADNIGRKSSSSLFGVGGGIIGSLAGITLAHFLGISVAVASTPLTGLGIVIGIFLYRGRRRILIERRIDENRLAIEEVLKRIKELPKDTPKDIRDRLWQTYAEFNFGYESQTRLLLTARNPQSDNDQS